MFKRLPTGRPLGGAAHAAGRRGRAALLALTAAAGLAILPGALTGTPAQADTGVTRGPFQIRNPASDACVQVVSGDSRDVQVVTGPCYASARSEWMFTQVLVGSSFGDVWQIRNVSTGLCLRALANRDFSVVDTIDCTGITNERWSVPHGGINAPSEIISIRSEISTGGAPCLDIYQGPLNTPIDVFHCGGGNLSQEWVIA